MCVCVCVCVLVCVCVCVSVKEYEKWFIDIAKLNTEEVVDIRKTMPEYIFESMRPETKVSVEYAWRTT